MLDPYSAQSWPTAATKLSNRSSSVGSSTTFSQTQESATSSCRCSILSRKMSKFEFFGRDRKAGHVTEPHLRPFILFSPSHRLMEEASYSYSNYQQLLLMLQESLFKRPFWTYLLHSSNLLGLLMRTDKNNYKYYNNRGGRQIMTGIVCVALPWSYSSVFAITNQKNRTLYCPESFPVSGERKKVVQRLTGLTKNEDVVLKQVSDFR
ncbi:hypothetical protein B0I73DRAFT_3209 [Yarrowia lipolytica]|uniref:Uncharacterized protein n=1 Tax=Yarrowia lipolytica TaxID=4952 RepID=A0A371C583_YARLL|nr:hypothetical protein B0I71DRAFT_42058 [Yarrowia lipolytica]RDW37824.1 hypothetical protein B0I73DRAFT_3209 [Yarrowia lipolytica]RDW47099.1 hypothetical protein B0I74DRAFT_21821 [Yarrowia lipolytica]RDW52676.1 hypothetical protein B0I75DRAFT_30310 [Yarrowia lipolytica]